MDQKKIGKFIAQCRKQKNMTQQELAERLNVSDRTIGNWENGRNMPDLSMFKPLCDELGISIKKIIRKSWKKISLRRSSTRTESCFVQRALRYG